MRLCRTNCAFLSNDGLCVEMMVSGRGRVALDRVENVGVRVTP